MVCTIYFCWTGESLLEGCQRIYVASGAYGWNPDQDCLPCCVIMAMGHAMSEELMLDPNQQVPVNASLLGLAIPTALDYPEIDSILVEAPVRAGPFGAKGLGENPMFNAAGAIGNAVFNATGVAVDRLPFSWPRVYRTLRGEG